jgi:serine protease inhibitor
MIYQARYKMKGDGCLAAIFGKSIRARRPQMRRSGRNPTSRIPSWTDLSDVLHSLGLSELLNHSAEALALFSHRHNASLDIVSQRNELTFNKYGVVAETATVANVALSGNGRRSLFLISPFVFIIRSRNGSVLFQGIYG